MSVNGSKAFEIRFAKFEDKEGIDKLMKYFLNDEPLFKYFRDNNIRDYHLPPDGEGPKQYSEPSLVAVRDGKIIGVCLSKITCREKLRKWLEQDCTSKIGRFLRHVMRESNIFKHFPGSSKAMDANILSVHPDYRRLGIGNSLLKRTRYATNSKKVLAMMALEMSNAWSIVKRVHFFPLRFLL